MTKLDNWITKNRWVVTPILYAAICIWMYLTASVEIEGVALPQHDAGIISLAVWHIMLLVAYCCAWLLHKTVSNVYRIRDLFRKIKKNKK